MRQPFDPRREFYERAELGDARHASDVHLAHLEILGDGRPWIVSELLGTERDLPGRVIDAEDLDGDFIAGRNRLRRVRHV